MFKQIKVWLALTTIFSLLMLVASCGKSGGNEPGGNNNATSGKPFKHSGDDGSVTGVVAYNGTPPAPKKITTDADPVCGKANPNLSTEDTVVKTANLRTSSSTSRMEPLRTAPRWATTLTRLRPSQ